MIYLDSQSSSQVNPRKAEYENLGLRYRTGRHGKGIAILDILWLVVGDVTIIPSSSWSVLGDARKAEFYICQPDLWPNKEAVGKPYIKFKNVLQNGLIPSVITIDGTQYQVTYANLYPRQK